MKPMREIEHVARGDRAGDRVLGPEEAVYDPRLPADLREDPSELAGDIGQNDREEHDPQEPAPPGERVLPREDEREKGEEDEEEAEGDHDPEAPEASRDGGPLIGGEVEEALHGRLGVVIGEEAEHVGDREGLDAVALGLGLRAARGGRRAPR